MDTPELWTATPARVHQSHDYPGWTADQYSYHVGRHGDPRVDRARSTHHLVGPHSVGAHHAVYTAADPHEVPPGFDGMAMGYSRPKYLPATAPLYSQDLLKLQTSTRARIDQLQGSLAHLDPCYEYGVEHWHHTRDLEKQRKQKSAYEPEVEDNVGWKDKNVLFSSQRQCFNQNTPQPDVQGTQSKAPINDCYLCSTVEEHRRHLARRGPQLKAKHKPKPRIHYEAPPPAIKTKAKEGAEENRDALYKVTVVTGTHRDAGTGANVFISLVGKAGAMKKRQLKKKSFAGAQTQYFGRGTRETFFLKAPKLGKLRWLTVQHDGSAAKHDWLLDRIYVLDMGRDELYVFHCGRWLSLKRQDCRTKRDLKAALVEGNRREFDVEVTTGKARQSGTDGRVSISIYGNQCVTSRERLATGAESEEVDFTRGATDRFVVEVEDPGVISKIRMHLEQGETSSDWLLEKVTLCDALSGKEWVFPCGSWLVIGPESGGSTYKDLYPTSSSRRVTKAEELRANAKKGFSTDIRYDVTVLTGTADYAGTDANVYITMRGKLGTTRELLMDNEKDNFEKGQTDFFKLKAEDVGDITSVNIRHDNSGLAAGWLLEELTIKKYLTKAEIEERMEDLEADFDERVSEKVEKVTGKQDTSHRQRYERNRQHTDSDHSDDIEQRDSRRNRRRSKARYDESDDDDDVRRRRKGRRTSRSRYDSSDEEDYNKSRGRGGRGGSRARGRSRDQSSDDEDDRSSRSRKSTIEGADWKRNSKGWKKGRVPYYDQYQFDCHIWLATDEGDGLIERKFKPKSVTTIFKVPTKD